MNFMRMEAARMNASVSAFFCSNVLETQTGCYVNQFIFVIAESRSIVERYHHLLLHSTDVWVVFGLGYYKKYRVSSFLYGYPYFIWVKAKSKISVGFPKWLQHFLALSAM